MVVCQQQQNKKTKKKRKPATRTTAATTTNQTKMNYLTKNLRCPRTSLTSMYNLFACGTFFAYVPVDHYSFPLSFIHVIAIVCSSESLLRMAS